MNPWIVRITITIKRHITGVSSEGSKSRSCLPKCIFCLMQISSAVVRSNCVRAHSLSLLLWMISGISQERRYMTFCFYYWNVVPGEWTILVLLKNLQLHCFLTIIAADFRCLSHQSTLHEVSNYQEWIRKFQDIRRLWQYAMYFEVSILNRLERI